MAGFSRMVRRSFKGWLKLQLGLLFREVVKLRKWVCDKKRMFLDGVDVEGWRWFLCDEWEEELKRLFWSSSWIIEGFYDSVTGCWRGKLEVVLRVLDPTVEGDGFGWRVGCGLVCCFVRGRENLLEVLTVCYGLVKSEETTLLWRNWLEEVVVRGVEGEEVRLWMCIEGFVDCKFNLL